MAATGLYWLVIDDVSELRSNEWGSASLDRVEPPMPSENNDCAGAMALPVGSSIFRDDLTNATNRFDPGHDGCPGAPGVTLTSRDVVPWLTARPST